MRQFTAKEVADYLDEAVEPAPVLLDVREPFEVAICAIEGSVNIPLGQVTRALNEFKPEQEIILICHHGFRSQRAGMFLLEHGYKRLINLVGGIDAWAREVDPDMTRY